MRLSWSFTLQSFVELWGRRHENRKSNSIVWFIFNSHVLTYIHSELRTTLEFIFVLEGIIESKHYRLSQVFPQTIRPLFPFYPIVNSAVRVSFLNSCSLYFDLIQFIDFIHLNHWSCAANSTKVLKITDHKFHKGWLHAAKNIRWHFCA